MNRLQNAWYRLSDYDVQPVYDFLVEKKQHYLVMDQDLGAVDSIKQSWAITKGHVLNLFVLALLAGVAMMVGVLLLIVGMFPAMVFALSLFGAAYRKISNT